MQVRADRADHFMPKICDHPIHPSTFFLLPMTELSTLLETDRLIMRPHVRADFDDSFAMWSDPEVTRFIGGQPSTREETWSRLLRYVGHWTMLGFGYWAVRDKVARSSEKSVLPISSGRPSRRSAACPKSAGR
jgi:RimJ/RimL family protein N-acetyltransferase